MNTIRFGIIGAGNIAHRFAKALQEVKNAELYAISGRKREKLEAFAKEYPVEKIFLSHDELLECKDVDAVYIALPHQLHKEWAIKALQHKKAVLLEKPATLNAQEMEEILTCAKENDTLFMEAQKGRFTPLYRTFKKNYEDGMYGKIQSIETSLCNQVPANYARAIQSYLYEPVVGGALLDVGTYCASILEDLCKGECTKESTEGLLQYDVDVYTNCKFQIGGIPVVLETALDRKKDKYAKIITDKAEIYIKDLHRPTEMIVTMNGKEETIQIPYDFDDFYSQIDEFVQLMFHGKKESEIMPIEGSLRIAQIIDFVRNEVNEHGTIKPFSYEEQMTSEDVLQQEKDLSFDAFTNEDAYRFVQNVLEILQEKKCNPVRIRVFFDEDIVAQYLMNGKKSDHWLNVKQAMVMETGHSTWYGTKKILEKDEEYQTRFQKRTSLPIGGGFPLIVNGTLRGAFIISGLTDPEDHSLVVEGIKKTKEKNK